jgi:5-methylcytosine-specific restriction endonuclease McrA
MKIGGKKKDIKKELKRECDKAWFEKHCEENCEVCGCSEGLQVHHFYYKSGFGHLRYDDNNAITLCKKCHFILHHQDPKKITDIIIERRGKKWHEDLKKRAYEKPKPSFKTKQWYSNQLKSLNENTH